MCETPPRSELFLLTYEEIEDKIVEYFDELTTDGILSYPEPGQQAGSTRINTEQSHRHSCRHVCANTQPGIKAQDFKAFRSTLGSFNQSPVDLVDVWGLVRLPETR